MVRNARAKIRRTQKAHGVDLTKELPLPKLKEFSTRTEFNQWKEQAESFTNPHNMKYQFRTNPYGVTVSKSDLLKMETNRRRSIQRAKDEIKRVEDFEIKQGGKTFATVKQRNLHFSEPDVTGVRVPSKINFNEIKNERRLREIIEADKKKQDREYYLKRKVQMKENFIEGLEKAYGNEADDLIDLIISLDPEWFYDLYIGNAEVDFDDFIYPGNEAVGVNQVSDHVNKVYAVLMSAIEGNTEFDDMRDF